MRKYCSALLALLLSGCSEPGPPPVPEPPPPAPIPVPQPPIPPEPVPETACAATENRRLAGRARATVPRIVGGRESMPGAYPWMAAIGYRTGSGTFNYCGGTLVASNWVLTAAHCQVLPGDVVTIGRHDMTGTDGVQVLVKRALTHAEYDAGTQKNDISLVELERHLISPYPVSLGDAPQSGMARAIGWGVTSEGGQASPVLREVDVPLMGNAQCANIYGVDMTQICAGEAGKDSCAGDSGGPLLFDGVQAGITSYGFGCAREGLPGVYTRVSAFVDWIESCIVEE